MKVIFCAISLFLTVNLVFSQNTTELELKKVGIYNFLSVGTVFGSALNEKPAPFSLLNEFNIRTGKHFAIGMVTGLEMLNEMVAPVGGNVKLLFTTASDNIFFTGLSGGYSVPLEKPEIIDNYYEVINAYGGGMFNAETGIVYPLKKELSLFVAAGYRYNELRYKRKDWSFQSVNRTMYYNRVSLRIGLVFH
ncbi:MAG: hypothetical protein JXB34_14545 [Bacteroidales bacterium]|nr:hypothetical protein [Bacteroidales bacterium]